MERKINKLINKLSNLDGTHIILTTEDEDKVIVINIGVSDKSTKRENRASLPFTYYEDLSNVDQKTIDEVIKKYTKAYVKPKRNLFEAIGDWIFKKL